MSSKRVLLVSNILSPYRIPVLREVASLPGIDFSACYLGRSEKSRKWDSKLSPDSTGFDFGYVPGIHLFVPGMDWSIHLNFGLLRFFLRHCPHVVVCTGYDCPAYFFAVLYAKIMRCKLVLWSGSYGYRAVSRKSLIKSIKRGFISCFDSYLAYGTGAADFLVDHGAPRDKIAVGYNAIDVDLFQRESERCREDGSLERLKEKYPGKNILCITRFLGDKMPDVLLEALGKMKQKDSRCLLLGWGPGEDDLREMVRRLNLEQRVVFLGYHSAEDIARLYTLADVFVLPSHREPWGLVINEAMACGTPVVVSRGAGCWLDLIEEGKTGYSYPAEDSEALAQILDNLILDEELCRRIGKKAQDKIRNFGPEKYAANLRRAIEEL